MVAVLQEILEKALARLGQQLVTYLPPLMVAVVILAVAYLLARVMRWLVLRAVKGIALDRFLDESGLSSMIDRAGRLHGVTVVAGAVFWTILGVGVLTALDVFNTKLTSQMIENAVYLFPKLLTGAAILVAGFWLAQYASRDVLVWAVNENLPFARRLAGLVKVSVGFVGVVVASDILDFASQVFYTAFVIFAGGAALATSLAIGFGVRGAVQQYLAGQSRKGQAESEPSLWNHL
ncbi:MAG TPA: hypothetical protein DEH78_11755 [Solibacterales bacterium]|nr:hypothetical protein [Bryobacterales bacterium]